MRSVFRHSLAIAVPSLTSCSAASSARDAGDCTASSCSLHSYYLKTTDGSFRLPDGGFDPDVCGRHCGSGPSSAFCALVQPDSGSFTPDADTVLCHDYYEVPACCVGGRGAPGMAPLSAVDGSAGSWLARMAELESVAVQGFSLLADELFAHGLPAHARAALLAATDEVRHAQALTRLSLGLGHCPVNRPLRPLPLRSLEEVAVDNAAEGCGRELLGASINLHQSQHAVDLHVRRTMAAIAPDEAGHARFSFELARALMPRLTLSQRRRVREAQEHALERLGGEDSPSEAMRSTLGLMDGEQLRAAAARILERERLG